MACIDCLNNCPEIISDKCVEYTGPDVPLLGICNGNSLSIVESLIINKLLTALDGTGIHPKDLNLETCQSFKAALGSKDPNVANLLQTLIDNQCTLKALIDAQAEVPVAFDIKCLTGLPSNPTKDQILQAVINTLCTVKSTVDAIPSTYVKSSELTTLVTNIIQQGNNGVPNYKDRMIPRAVMEYYGELSNFDNTGKGIAALGFDKVYLCNGLNGTPDRRGRVGVGAVRNVPGGSLDTDVNPMLPVNPNTNYALNDKFGKNYWTLSNTELPPHTHGVNDPGHDHSLPSDIQYNGNAAGGESGTDEKAPTANKRTGTSTTGITVNSSGGGQPHENRQPSIAALYIMFIP